MRRRRRSRGEQNERRAGGEGVREGAREFGAGGGEGTG